MPIIIPAILTDRVDTLQAHLKTASGFASRAQLDFALAPFIDPTSTVHPADVPHLAFKGILEAHVMAHNPVQYCDDVKRMGCDMMYFHFEADGEPERVVHEVRARGLKAGLALNPATSWKRVKKKIIREVDAVLFMTVFPGKQGNVFQGAVLESVKAFTSVFPDVPVAVDGGINRETLTRAIEAGASLIAVGSAIWGAQEGPEAAYRQLEKIANQR